jgi:hypothetical protein
MALIYEAHSLIFGVSLGILSVSNTTYLLIAETGFSMVHV